MKTRPETESLPSRNAKLHLVTAKALEADRKARTAKDKARVAKLRLKAAKRDFKAAKGELKEARKTAKKTLREAQAAHEALQACLDKIAKEKKKDRKHAAATKAAPAQAGAPQARPKPVLKASKPAAPRLRRPGAKAALPPASNVPAPPLPETGA